MEGTHPEIGQCRSALYHELEDDMMTLPSGILRKKKWLVSSSDLDVMYCHYQGKPQISLWCDGKAIDNGLSDDEQPNPPKKRKKDKDSGHKFNEKESEAESIFLKLKEKHGSDNSGPQLKLWARMITAKTHDDFDNPPKVPMITGVEKKLFV